MCNPFNRQMYAIFGAAMKGPAWNSTSCIWTRKFVAHVCFCVERPSLSYLTHACLCPVKGWLMSLCVPGNMYAFDPIRSQRVCLRISIPAVACDLLSNPPCTTFLLRCLVLITVYSGLPEAETVTAVKRSMPVSSCMPFISMFILSLQPNYSSLYSCMPHKHTHMQSNGWSYVSSAYCCHCRIHHNFEAFLDWGVLLVCCWLCLSRCPIPSGLIHILPGLFLCWHRVLQWGTSGLNLTTWINRHQHDCCPSRWRGSLWMGM